MIGELPLQGEVNTDPRRDHQRRRLDHGLDREGPGRALGLGAGDTGSGFLNFVQILYF